MGNFTSKISKKTDYTVRHQPFGATDPFDDKIDNLFFEEEGERYEIRGELLKRYFITIVQFGKLNPKQWNDILELLPKVQKYAHRRCCFCFVFENKLGEHHIRGDPDFQVCKLCIEPLRNHITTTTTYAYDELQCLYYRCPNMCNPRTFPFCSIHHIAPSTDIIN